MSSGGNTIAAAPGTYASPAALTTNTWGYRVDGAGTFGAGTTTPLSNAALGSVTYAQVLTTPQNIKTTSTTAAGDNTSVWYSVAAKYLSILFDKALTY